MYLANKVLIRVVTRPDLEVSARCKYRTTSYRESVVTLPDLEASARATLGTRANARFPATFSRISLKIATYEGETPRFSL